VRLYFDASAIVLLFLVDPLNARAGKVLRGLRYRMPFSLRETWIACPDPPGDG
jgi:hypothetical protein